MIHGSRSPSLLIGALLACGAASTILVAGERAAAVRPAPYATLVLRGGRIVTMDDAHPEARALAIRGDRILAVGSEADVKPLIGPSTRVLELRGALAVPGFIDAHAHFRSLGERKLNLDLMGTTSWDEIVAMVAAAARRAKKGEWIIGRGWHQEKWTKLPEPRVEGFPVHDALSKVSPDNPVLLTHASGHAAISNAKAMELAGITKERPNPPGGEILKGADGRPTGLLRENADDLVARVREVARAKRSPGEVEADERRFVELATEECLAKGLTTVHDAGVPLETIDLYTRLARERRLGVRLYAMVRERPERLAPGLAAVRTIGAGNGYLTVRAVKVQIDGALGSRGAWLLAPYSDLPGSAGLETTPVETVKEIARLCLANGYQLATHAIGDRANRETLDIYEQAFRSRPDAKDLRWRIEHAQHLDPADIPRFGKLGVIASMQGIHCTSDAPYVLARLGARRAEEGAYVWQKLAKSGAVIANGTDAPVEDIDPIPCFHASVTRRLKDGSVFYPEQRMSRMEALRTYTTNAAYAAFEEKEKGSLAPGKLADVTVLSKDILTVPDDQILSTRVVATIVGGNVTERRAP